MQTIIYSFTKTYGLRTSKSGSRLGRKIEFAINLNLIYINCFELNIYFQDADNITEDKIYIPGSSIF